MSNSPSTSPEGTGAETPPPLPAFGPPSRHPDLAAVRHEIAVVRAAASSEVPAGVRGRFLKRLMLRAFGLLARRQVTFNHSVVRALEAVDGVLSDLETQRASLRAALATAEARLDQLDSDERLREIGAEVQRLRDQQRSTGAQLMVQRSLVESVLREARRALPDQMGPDQLQTLALALEQQGSELYEAFENRFRGARDDVRRLLEVYLDDVRGEEHGQAPVLDVGCGRGEWLELLRDSGVPAYGVDTNDAFVQANTDRGLDVRHDDALVHLNKLPESTLRAVTAFHLVEHLDLDHALSLIDAALRALRPGGRLILETPNPTNLVVGASAFYLDPTHIKPVHPEFLDFLLAARGFTDVEIRWLHPVGWDRPSAEGDGDLPRLLDDIGWYFYGPQDYAVVGRKPSLPS